jgi:hypothetical protein
MNFVVYMIGMLFVVGALAYAASLVGVGTQWITIGVIALLGIGLMGGIVKTRQKDPS